MLSEHIYTECVSESFTISKTTDIMQTQSNKLHGIKWFTKCNRISTFKKDHFLCTPFGYVLYAIDNW